MAATNLNAHSLSQALAQISSGAFVLTVQDDETPRAMLVSFVQQVGLDPPRVVVAIAKERAIVPALDRDRAFVLNTCADGDPGLVRRFAEAPEQAARILAEAGAHPVAGGMVLDAAAGHLVCNVVQRVDIGDHWLYIADVRSGATVEGRQPLVHVRRSGLRY